MNESRIESEIEKHKRAAEGHQLHADELQRFKKERAAREAGEVGEVTTEAKRPVLVASMAAGIGDDEKIQMVRDEYGTGGYGMFCIVVGEIARRTGGNSVALPLKKWAGMLDIRLGYAVTVIEFIEGAGLWKTNIEEIVALLDDSDKEESRRRREELKGILPNLTITIPDMDRRLSQLVGGRKVEGYKREREEVPS